MPTWCSATWTARRCSAAACASIFAAAERAIDADVARPLGLTVAEAAARIAEVVNSNMAQALRIVSVERGHDPQEFSLIAFGGAGPVHAVALAEELQIPEVIIPPAPGAFSALGPGGERPEARLLPHAVRRPGAGRTGARRRGASPAWKQPARRCWKRRRCRRPQRALLRFADVRYRRQAYELTVPVADGPVTRAALDALAEAFHAKHAQTYGHANRSEMVQLVNLRVTALGRLPGLQAGAARRSRTARGCASRDVWFPGTGFVATPVHWRSGLSAGETLAGPAVIEALDSTAVVPPGWQRHGGRMGLHPDPPQ